MVREEGDKTGSDEGRGEVIPAEDVQAHLTRLHEEARLSHSSLDAEWLGVRGTIQNKRGERTSLHERIRQTARVIKAWEEENLKNKPTNVISLRSARLVTPLFNIEEERVNLARSKKELERVERDLETLEETSTTLEEAKVVAYNRMRRIAEIQKNYLISKRERETRGAREENEG